MSSKFHYASASPLLRDLEQVTFYLGPSFLLCEMKQLGDEIPLLVYSSIAWKANTKLGERAKA